MPVIISGSTGISGTDGSAGTPAVQGTDANTGMFFPAADTIAFSEGGVEAMRLDASGNVGIGTSSPSTFGRLAVSTPTAGFGLLGIANSVGGGGGVQMATYYGNAKISYIDTTLTNGTPGAETAYMAFATPNNGTLAERARITSTGNLQFNSGYGSVATAFGCRAWVNFNGTGTVAIRTSGNVSSITDGGVGIYTVNFATAMPDTNYCTVVSASPDINNGADGYPATWAAGNITVYYILPGTSFYDNANMQVAVFR